MKAIAGTRIQIGAALRAKALAVLLAEEANGQLKHERIPDRTGQLKRGRFETILIRVFGIGLVSKLSVHLRLDGLDNFFQTSGTTRGNNGRHFSFDTDIFWT